MGATLLKEHFTLNSYEGTCVFRGKIYRVIVRPEEEVEQQAPATPTD
jgi:hypothetical protein